MNNLFLPRQYSVYLACCVAVYANPAHSVDLGALGEVSNVTANQTSAGNAIGVACLRGGNDSDFQNRCNGLAGLKNNQGTAQLPSILGQVTSEQTAAQNTQSLEMNNNHMATLSNRISAIRNGRASGGLQLSGLMLDSNGAVTQLAKVDRKTNKAAAGDGDFDRLGVFVNGNIGVGDRRTTVNEIGYNQDTHGVTAGVDYRFTDNFLLGTAFSYNNARTGYTKGLGNMDTDSFSGALYASFFTDNGFFVDGIFSGSHADYTSNRHIQYNVPEVIDTVATGKNQGNEFNIAMTSGFNFTMGGLTLTPQVRVDYTHTDVDALDEQGGQGWALHVDQQSFESLQTAAGLQLAYTINLPWAVIIPTARAEYIHEFQNDSRNIRAYYLGDKNLNKAFFNIGTDNPDRDFIVASAGLSAQFAHGISAFVNYDTVQAHSFINNHNFSGGIRMELSF
ncbi:MAG: autotransporter outer membrane beta-barrel domain-containing protein [Methylococcaceae bacterium]|nr:autotransporter outer membrane beta-barrel domain-containing protein [Methylococcaceae bacterium]